MTDKEKKNLRSGYTTGSCAAAAAKAAAILLLTEKATPKVTIGFPDGSRHNFTVLKSEQTENGPMASVVKDAGDDPDVTNGAEIGVFLKFGDPSAKEKITLLNGKGVGTVTKPGLPVAIGEPAINPVPRQMIRQAITEALQESGKDNIPLEATVFVTKGEILAKSTLNKRLGIIGGLSILGTTGIVKPISTKAWTDTIEASMSVARAIGLDTVLLSTGRTSEKAVQDMLQLQEESLVMMGDYLQYAVEAAARHKFEIIVFSAMWAKLLKAALGIPQTHVRHGALEPKQAAELLEELGLDQEAAKPMAEANTAREIYERLMALGRTDLIHAVCIKAQEQVHQWSGLKVDVYLVTSEQGVVHHVPH